VTVAEIIAEQRRKCEADRAARMRPRPVPVHDAVPAPRKLTPAEVERAYIDDRTYDGKAPDGGMYRTIRRENPDEYVARDGTRTFVPWRYVSMQDLELPDGNAGNTPDTHGTVNGVPDPWGRPSGYVASNYDPWGETHGDTMGAPHAQATGDGLDDWLAPPAQAGDTGNNMQPYSWLAPQGATEGTMAQGGTGMTFSPAGQEETLELMRNMRR